MKIWGLFLFCLSLCFSQAQATGSCNPHFLNMSDYIPNDIKHVELYLKLHNANVYLKENLGKLTTPDLIDKGFLVLDNSTPILRNGQPMPFNRYLLPHALTGFYMPSYEANAQAGEKYFANLILLPGTGSTASDVSSMLDVAGTFGGKRKGAGKNILNPIAGNEGKFRLKVFAADMPYLGMGKQTPFEFGNPDAVMKMVEHIHLITQIMGPKLKTFIAGRSQGGLIALEYAGQVDSIAGAIALSPSHSDPKVMKYTRENLQTMLDDDKFGADFDVDKRSWVGYLTYTGMYQVYNHPFRSRALIQAGELDTDYPREIYQGLLKQFIDENPGVEFSLYKDGRHNLWNRTDEVFYSPTILEMAQFIYRSL